MAKAEFNIELSLKDLSIAGILEEMLNDEEIPLHIRELYKAKLKINLELEADEEDDEE